MRNVFGLTASYRAYLAQIGRGIVDRRPWQPSRPDLVHAWPARQLNKLAGKYYAVRVGRSTGIFRSWEECRRQVNGFSGSVFRSFASLKDAQDFIRGPAWPAATRQRSHYSSAATAVPAAVDVATLHATADSAAPKLSSCSTGSYRLEFDGASRGNPGPAGAGAVLYKADGTEVGRLCVKLGFATNNIAEYTALIQGLQAAQEVGIQRLAVAGDSLLVVNQVNSEWECRHAGLKPLHQQAHHLSGQFAEISFAHIRREFNTVADRLSNEAIDMGGWVGLRRWDDEDIRVMPGKRQRVA